MTEIWKHIPGYENSYKVSDLGRVMACEKVWVTGRGTCRYKQEHIMKVIFRRGYSYVPLTKNGNQLSKLVHRLVAMAFIANPENKRTVNHKNGIKDDNRLENLEWATYSEQQKHAFDTGLRFPSDKRLKPVIQYSAYGDLIREWESFKQITDVTGYDRSPIIKVCKNKQQTSYGFKWKYKDEKNYSPAKAFEESAGHI